MSDLIGLAGSLLPSPLQGLLGGSASGWRGKLQKASFRGVPFHVLDHELTAGRRIAVHEFPLRDRIATEDLGRGARRFQVTAYVLGDDYFAQRDALLRACEEESEPGTLVHPYLGEWKVRCESIGLRESQREGRIATISLVFVEEGERPAPAAQKDRLGSALAQIGQVLSLARSAFALIYAHRGDLGGFLLRAATSYVSGLGEALAGSFLGLPGLDITQIRGAISGLGQVDLTDSAAASFAIGAPFVALADASAEAPAGRAVSAAIASDAIDATVTTSRGETVLPPGWCGTLLLDFASYAGADPGTAALPVPDLVSAGLASIQAALDGLVRDSAVAAAAQVFIETDWPSSDTAAAARDALCDAILARAEAAADAGLDDLYAGWMALLAEVSRYLTERGVQRPRLATYALPQGLPSLALAHRLYQDARRADELVALNRVPHPAFLPASGVALQPGATP